MVSPGFMAWVNLIMLVTGDVPTAVYCAVPFLHSPFMVAAGSGYGSQESSKFSAVTVSGNRIAKTRISFLMARLRVIEDVKKGPELSEPYY